MGKKSNRDISEEMRLCTHLSELVSGESGTGKLNHGSDHVLKVLGGLLLGLDILVDLY